MRFREILGAWVVLMEVLTFTAAFRLLAVDASESRKRASP